MEETSKFKGSDLDLFAKKRSGHFKSGLYAVYNFLDDRLILFIAVVSKLEEQYNKLAISLAPLYLIILTDN